MQRNELGQFIEGHTPWIKGKNHTEKTKKKLSKNNARIWLGKHRSKETKKKIGKANSIALREFWDSPKGVELKKKMAIFMTGKKLSTIHRKHISESHIGKKNHFYGKKHSKTSLQKMSNNHWTKGERAEELKKIHSIAMKGRKATKEHKQKISVGIIKHFDQTGRKTKEYKLIRGGKKFKVWRKEVFERDDYTCQECGARCGNGYTVLLNAHHIKSFTDYPEWRFDINNGVTLCTDCHYLYHTKSKEIH